MLQLEGIAAVTPDDARAINKRIQSTQRQAAQQSGGSWPAKVVGRVNGYYTVEDPFGRTRVVHSSMRGKLRPGVSLTITETAEGVATISGHGAAEF